MAFTAALVSSFWHPGHLGIDFVYFLHRPPKEGMSHPAISWPRVSFGVFSTFWFLIFICI